MKMVKVFSVLMALLMLVGLGALALRRRKA